MNPSDLLKPQALQGVATLFIIGFVFRHVEGQVRVRRKEGDLHMTVLAVAWSLVIFAFIQLIQKPMYSWVPDQAHLAVSLASYIAVAAVLGYLWGKSRLNLPIWWQKWRSKRPSLPDLFPTGYSQTVLKVLESSKEYVEIKVQGEWFQGMVWHYDRDSERFLDLHFTLRHPAIKKDGQWLPIGEAEEMMFSMRDVQVFNRLRPFEPEASTKP